MLEFIAHSWPEQHRESALSGPRRGEITRRQRKLGTTRSTPRRGSLRPASSGGKNASRTVRSSEPAMMHHAPHQVAEREDRQSALAAPIATQEQEPQHEQRSPHKKNQSWIHRERRPGINAGEASKGMRRILCDGPRRRSQPHPETQGKASVSCSCPSIYPRKSLSISAFNCSRVNGFSSIPTLPASMGLPPVIVSQ